MAECGLSSGCPKKPRGRCCHYCSDADGCKRAIKCMNDPNRCGQHRGPTTDASGGLKLSPNKLRKQREHKGWPVSRVSTALGVTLETVKKWERGNVKVPPLREVQLCELYKCERIDIYE